MNTRLLPVTGAAEALQSAIVGALAMLRAIDDPGKSDALIGPLHDQIDSIANQSAALVSEIQRVLYRPEATQ